MKSLKFFQANDSGSHSWWCSGLNQTLNIWIASPLILPHAITNTRTALTTGQNVDTTCLQSPLILENSSDKKKWVKANSHKQISHIQHVSFKQSDRDSVKLCHIASPHQYLLWLLYLWKKYQLKWKYSSQNSLLIKANWEKAYLC